MNPEVSCYNTSSLVTYINSTKGEEGVNQLLNGIDGIDAKYLSDPNNWISLEMLFHLFDNVKHIYNNHNPKLFFDLGKKVSAMDAGALVTLAKWFGNTKSLIKSSPSFNRRFNVDQEMDVAFSNQEKARVINYFVPEFFDRERKDQCEWTKGIFAGIPMLWDLPSAKIKELVCSFRLEEILSRDFSYLGLNYEIKNGLLSIDGIEYARKVALVENQIEKPLFTNVRETPPGIQAGSRLILNGDWTQDELAKRFKGFLVTKNLIINGEIILKKGEIYNSPYCLYEIQWKKLGFVRNIVNRTFSRYKLFFESKNELEKMLILSEQRLFETEKAKNELRIANLQLQEHAVELESLVQKRTKQLIREEKKRRIYQVRAAQADAVARFLHQTSNLVLQPLASTMIVFEDFLEIIEEVKSEWADDHAEDDLFIELDQSLERIQQVYPTAQQVIHGYRELFHAFYEIYVSTKVERDLNQDLRYIETLVKNKYILTEVVLKLELDPQVPLMKLEGGVQSIFLELMHNAADHGAKNILVKSQYEPAERQVQLSFYNDGEPIPEEKWATALDHKVSDQGSGYGMADARYIIETLNNGKLIVAISSLGDYKVHFTIVLNIPEV